jgi:pyruvate carboxylase subunit B
VTQELKDYLQGLYGRPPKPADQDVRRMVLGRDEPITIRPADLLEPQLDRARGELKKNTFEPADDAVLNYLLFPSTTLKLLRGELAPQKDEKQEEPSKPAETEPTGEAKAEEPAGEAAAQTAEDEEAPGPVASTAEFEVEVEGELFKVRVSGVGLQVARMPSGGAAPAAAAPTKAAPPAGAVVAPMQGLIVKVPVKKGDEVKLGDVVAVLEAMKMQNDIVTSVAGKVLDVYVKEGEVVSPNQPILAIG